MDAKQQQERAQSLSLDLQRKEDDANDLREKLADYKKQIQQVQKEVRSGSSTWLGSEVAASPAELATQIVHLHVGRWDT